MRALSFSELGVLPLRSGMTVDHTSYVKIKMKQELIKVAGMTYRQDGNDFWPGPLNADVASDDYGTIGADVCSDFDKHSDCYHLLLYPNFQA